MNHTSDAAPVVPGLAQGPRRPVRRLLRLVRHRRPLRGRADHLRRHRAVQLDLGPGAQQYFWHRFFSHQPDLNFDNPRGPRGDVRGAVASGSTWASTASGCDAVPYLYERPGTNGENLPETHAFLRTVRRVRRRPATPAGCCWPRPTSGRPTSSTTSATSSPVATSATWLPLPGDAAHLHGGAPRVALPDLGDPRADPADPGRLPVGDLPAQPRRADPRDGHRRGPRLHVGRVRPGPADEGQHRHPPPAGAAARQRHQPDRAVHRAAAVAARLPGPLLRRRDRDGRQHLARRPRRRPHARCSGPRTATPASPSSDPGRLHLPAGRRTRSTATRASTSRPSCAQRLLAAALDAPDDPRPQASTTPSAWAPSPTSAAPTRACCPTCASSDDVVLCVNNLSRFPQPVELDLRRWEGRIPVELLGGVPFPADRRAALPADRRRLRLLLVPAHHDARERVRLDDRPDAVPRATAALVRRQGPPLRVVDRHVPRRPGPPRRAGRSAGRHRPGGRRVRRRRGRRRRSTSSRWRATASRRAGSRTRCVGRVGGSRPRRVHGLRRAARPRGDGVLAAARSPRPSAGRAAGASTGWPSTTSTCPCTPRCCPRSSPTPRWSSATTSLMKVFRRVAPGAQPRHRGARGADPGRVRPGRGALRVAGRDSRLDPDGPAARWPCSSSSCARPATAGSWRWPASATCSPRPTCTPTRWAATSPARPPGSARRWPRSTPTCAPHFRPVRRRPGRGWPRRCASGSTPPWPWCPSWPSTRPTPARRLRTVSPSSAGSTAQRIHGDLHLGQTLRTVQGWKLVDFEGEPAKPLAERRAARLACWRDVAGHAALLRLRRPAWSSSPWAATTRTRPRSATFRAGEWAERNRAAFLATATPAATSTADEQAMLLRRTLADKAVYEVVYEARNRPAGLPIPLPAIDRLAGDRMTTSHCRVDRRETRAARRHGASTDDPHARPRTAPRTGRRSRSACSSRWPPAVAIRVRRHRACALAHEHAGRLGRRAAAWPRCPTTGSAVDLRRRPPTSSTTPTASCPTLGEIDLHLINEGRHEQLWDGARRPRAHYDGAAVTGTSFAVWAPSARGVRVIGDFNSWDGREHPMRRSARPGVWELFVPDVGAGTRYKFEILGADGEWRREGRPDGLRTPRCRRPTASVVFESRYAWGDDDWMTTRGRRHHVAGADVASTRCTSARGAPWGTTLDYGQLADELVRLPRRPRLHPRRAAAGDGAPVRRVVGLPGHVVLRADRAVRRPRRLPLPRRPAAPGRHRRDRRLGAGALPQGRLRAGPLRRHAALRAPQPPPRRAPRLGHLRLQLRPQRGAQLPGRQRALLARGVPRRRAAGRRRRLDALPGLLARGRRVVAQRLRRPGEPRGGRSSCRR